MLLKEDLPRGVWKMAKITELISSNDGKIRGAKVLLPSKKVLNRPLTLLYQLECDSGREIEMTQDGEHLKETEEHFVLALWIRFSSRAFLKESRPFLSFSIGIKSLDCRKLRQLSLWASINVMNYNYI